MIEYMCTFTTDRREKLISIGLILFVITSYALFMHNRTMPLTEAWYTYYAQCINSGAIPYKDFEYLFPPVYLYMITLFTKIVGYKIIYLRLLGVVFYTVLSIGLYFVFRMVFKNWIATIVTITSALYLQTEVAQVFYDYIRLMDIFAVYAIWFLMKIIFNLKKNENKKANRDAIISGMLCAFFIMVKQNSGGIFFIFSILMLLCFKSYLKLKWDIFKAIMVRYIGTVCVIGILCITALYLEGNLFMMLSSSGESALAAKGGLYTILFGWIIVARLSRPKSINF